MKIHSIDLPKTQGAVAFVGSNLEHVSDSYFQSEIANDNAQNVDKIQRDGASSDGENLNDPLIYSSGSVKTPKPGRPRSAPWYKHRENGRLRYGRKAITKFIADDVVAEMLDGAQHAGVIKAPLNTFVTIRPANIDDDVRPEDRSTLWSDVRNRIQMWLKHHGVEPIFVWSRESEPEKGERYGTGEHMHLLLNLPSNLRGKLKASLMERFPDHAEVDVRPASDIVRRADNGKIMSAVTYVVKALSPQARRKSSQPYRKSGPVVGKRAGATRNISAKAIAAYRSSTSKVTRRVA